MHRDPSVASRCLDVIEQFGGWIDTSAIYEQVAEAENITIVSVSCRDLVGAGKVVRRKFDGRWKYHAKQPDLLGNSPEVAELEQTLSAPVASVPAHKSAAHRLGGQAARHVPKQLKLRTLDRLAEIVAEDIAHVLRAVRGDIERAI